MLVIVGGLIVISTVLGGYVLHHGKISVLIQPTEFLIIGGAAIGSLVLASPMSLIKNIIAQLLGTLKAKEATKEDYLDLLNCLFKLFKLAKQNLLGLEPHVEEPANSDIFKEHPKVLANHHAIHFICDTMKVQIATPLGPFELEELMDSDLKSAHAEEHLAPAAINKVGDAMPGLGIVAAVLGVVITMGKLSEGKEVIGQSVAAALVGTFIGVLASYGFLGPLATKMESVLESDGQLMQVVKVAILAFAKDSSPKVCVEFARRTIPPHIRPSFEELDAATSGGAAKAA